MGSAHGREAHSRADTSLESPGHPFSSEKCNSWLPPHGRLAQACRASSWYVTQEEGGAPWYLCGSAGWALPVLGSVPDCRAGAGRAACEARHLIGSALRVGWEGRGRACRTEEAAWGGTRRAPGELPALLPGSPDICRQSPPSLRSTHVRGSLALTWGGSWRVHPPGE